MKDDYKYQFFVPKKFTIGLNNKNDGFPSMKDKDGRWSNLSVFENHCGFKPNFQRNARKEIHKVLSQNVQEIDNVPLSGFRVINLRNKIYNTELYKNVDCVELHDPRGWNIQVSIDTFKAILSSNGMNLRDGYLDDVKLMYAWPKYYSSYETGPFTLILESKRAYEMQEATEKLVNIKSTVTFIAPSKFEVGKIYSATTTKMAGCFYMYLGTHAIYSDDCHFKAVMRGSYKDLDAFVADKRDATNLSRHIFYCLNPNFPVVPESYGIFGNHPGAAPYFYTGNLSKLFEKVEDVDPAKFKMHNDPSKPATFENIKADMEVCAYFNLIDFSKSGYDVDLSYSTL